MWERGIKRKKNKNKTQTKLLLDHNASKPNRKKEVNQQQ
jgi:hypothetical protein